MRTPTAILSVTLLAIALTFAPSGAILVDGGGGGDYLTIQEGVDAASDIGDVVYVAPGVYTDTHVFDILGADRRVNVYFEKGITLVSTDGPEVTIIDGGGITDFGVLAMPYDLGIPGIDPFPPIVQGFTVRNGGSSFRSAGIVAFGGQARGNIATDYESGFATGVGYDYVGITGGRSARTNVSLITGNTAEGNVRGVLVASNEDGFAAGTVSENVLSGNSYGVGINGPDCSTQLVGNEISLNGVGVRIWPGPSWQGGTLDITLQSNRVIDNTNKAVWIDRSWSSTGYFINVTIGGSPATANDIHGSPVSLFTYDNAAATVLDARYNCWGSTDCDVFVPQFAVDDEPEVEFTYLPFVDESHTEIYETCDGPAVENATWSAIKAMYRQEVRAPAGREE